MKRMHVHVRVDDLDASISFYATLFGVAPAVRQADYAKWMLEDPRVNFAISNRMGASGVDHLGIQVESNEELTELAGRLKTAAETRDQVATTCCYATSDKSWVNDPSGLRWETFYTHGEAVTYGEDEAGGVAPSTGAGCASEHSAIAPTRAACC